MLSYEKLEKVVYPPQMPVIRNSLHSVVSVAYLSEKTIQQADNKAPGYIHKECARRKSNCYQPAGAKLHQVAEYAAQAPAKPYNEYWFHMNELRR